MKSCNYHLSEHKLYLDTPKKVSIKMSSANNSSINGRNFFFTEFHLQIQNTHMHLCYMQNKIVTFFFFLPSPIFEQMFTKMDFKDWGGGYLSAVDNPISINDFDHFSKHSWFVFFWCCYICWPKYTMKVGGFLFRNSYYTLHELLEFS